MNGIDKAIELSNEGKLTITQAHIYTILLRRLDEVKGGVILASVRWFERQYRITPKTYLHALEVLQNEGLLTFVSDTKNGIRITITGSNAVVLGVGKSTTPTPTLSTTPTTTPTPTLDTTTEIPIIPKSLIPNTYIKEADKSAEKEELKSIDDSGKKSKGRTALFVPPTIEECRQYFIQHATDYHMTIIIAKSQAEIFFNYYESDNWKRGKDKKQIDKWRGCAAVWGLKYKAKNPPPSNNSSPQSRPIQPN